MSGRESLVSLDGLICGDELLVDGSPYTGAGNEWAPLKYVSPGSASIYPYKVRVSNGATGQYAGREIQGVRRPKHLANVIAETDAIHPGWLESLVENARWPR